MAVPSFITTFEGYCAAPTTINFSGNSGTSGSNRILIGIVSMDTAGVAITNITYAGQALTLITNPTNRANIYYLLNPPTGSNTFDCDFDSAINATATFAVYDDVDQTTPYNSGNIQTASGSSGTSESVTITAANTNRVIHMIGVNGGNLDSLTSETGDSEVTRNTTITSGTPGGCKSGLADLPGTGSATTPGWTWTNNQAHAQVAVELYQIGNAPAAGRIFKLAGEGGGLAGPARGLAA